MEPTAPTSSKKRKNTAKSTIQSRKRSKADGDIKYIPRAAGPTGQLNPEEKEKSARWELDGGRCVITDIANPDVCHILPLATCARQEIQAQFKLYFDQSSMLLWDDEDDETDNLNAWFITGLGVSDKAWNMISLNTQLHRWWGKAYFGFRCQGILPGPTDKQQLIRLQFHWLPGALSNERNKEDLRTHLSHTWGPQQGVAAFRVTGQPITTGDVFDVVVAAEDALKMKAAFDLQWALIRVAALVGAANVYADAADSDDPGPAEERLTEEVSVDVFSWLDLVEPGLPDNHDNDNDDNDGGVDNTSKLPIMLTVQTGSSLGQLEHIYTPASTSEFPADLTSTMKENQKPMPVPNAVPPGGSMEESEERVLNPMRTVLMRQF